MTRSTAPQPLAQVDVTVPESLAMRKARLRVDAFRTSVGRVATLAGAAAATAGMFTGDVTGMSLVADAALTLTGLATLRLWKPDGHQKATASVLYLVPGVSLAALLVGERVIPGINPAEALALTVWTVGTWVTQPARLARRLLSPPLPAPATALVPAAEVVDGHPAARWWAWHVAVEDGAAPGTALQDVERTGEASIRAIIRSTIPGQPVPDISKRRLSALMDVPEDDIDIAPVPGRGAGVRLLKVGQPDEATDPAAVWAKRIAPLAMPGATLTSVRSGRQVPGPSSEED
ncbi:hypothetical protein [Nonomuraea sp. NPDC049646]|uniref:hypothetical protein n=1 Tax=unclassified Nonomuraea TaxID=2593643 RepID=UPI0037AC196F